jgi:hypothetical protein
MVYVDQPFDARIFYRDGATARTGARHGHKWCHLFADTEEELHAMAAAIGMRRSWFQNKPGFPHYDLVMSRRKHAVSLGAVEVDLADFIKSRRNHGQSAE